MQTAPATRWATHVSWPQGPFIAAQPGPGTPEALIGLLERDVQRGHVHVAVRHLLMLDACGAQVPQRLRGPCEAWLSACNASKRAAIAAQVQAWARMALRPPRRA
jgi:hypothetical protein